MTDRQAALATLVETSGTRLHGIASRSDASPSRTASG